MTKVIDCALIELGWACGHVIRAAGEAEALRLAAMHARSHGAEPSPALLARARELMRDEGGSLPMWEAAVQGALNRGMGPAIGRRSPMCLTGRGRRARARSWVNARERASWRATR